MGAEKRGATVGATSVVLGAPNDTVGTRGGQIALGSGRRNGSIWNGADERVAKSCDLVGERLHLGGVLVAYCSNRLVGSRTRQSPDGCFDFLSSSSGDNPVNFFLSEQIGRYEGSGVASVL